jgi:hypothetical protein
MSFPKIPRPGIKFLEKDGTVTLEWYRFLDDFLRGVTNPTGFTGDEAFTDAESNDLTLSDQLAQDALLQAFYQLEQDASTSSTGTNPISQFLVGQIWQYYIGIGGNIISTGLFGGSGFGGSTTTALDSTTWGGRMQGLEFANAGVNSLAGPSSGNYWQVGSATNGGGVEFFCFGRLGSTFRTTAGMLSGLIVNSAAMSATPSTAANNGFMGCYIDAGVANWKLGVRDRAGTVNSFDTGIAWATNQFYGVHVSQAKGNAAPCKITFGIFDSTTGASSPVSNTFSTGFPISSDQLAWQNVVFSAAGNDKLQFFRALGYVPDGVFSSL